MGEGLASFQDDFKVTLKITLTDRIICGIITLSDSTLVGSAQSAVVLFGDQEKMKYVCEEGNSLISSDIIRGHLDAIILRFDM